MSGHELALAVTLTKYDERIEKMTTEQTNLNQYITQLVNQLAVCNKVLSQTAIRLTEVRGETQAVRDICTVVRQNEHLIEQRGK